MSARGGKPTSPIRARRDRVLLWGRFLLLPTSGPQIADAQDLKGLESKLIACSVSSQLGGELSYDWHKNGLVVTVRMRRDKLEK